MLMRVRTRRKGSGQSTLEYAILIAVVIAVLITMQVYIKRAMSGRTKDLADQQFGRQFDPLRSDLQVTVSSTGTRNETQFTNGLSTSNIVGNEESSRVVNRYNAGVLNENTLSLGFK